jgi:hypothetical protein
MRLSVVRVDLCRLCNSSYTIGVLGDERYLLRAEKQS